MGKLPTPGPWTALGADVLGQAINAFSRGRTNNRQEDFAREMYDRQRQDNLADYNMMNEYNSPAAQMARYKAAGLNPNLIYGQSNEGAAVRSTNAPTINPQPVEFSAGSALASFNDTALRQAQTDNLLAQNAVIKQEAIYKAAQIAALSVSTGRNAINSARDSQRFHQEESLYNTYIEASKENLRSIQIKNQVNLDENERRAALTAKSLAEAAERILTARMSRAKTEAEIKEIGQRIRNLRQDENIKQLDVDLRKINVHPGDSGWWRALMKILNSDAANSIKDQIGAAIPK